MNRTALGWLKVCYDVDKEEWQIGTNSFLFLPSSYGYRLAIGYFRMVIGGVEIYLRIPSEFGGHGLLPCFGFSRRSFLWLGCPSGVENCSLESPWSYADVRVFNGVKTFGLGIINSV